MLEEGPLYLYFIQTLIKCEILKTQKNVSQVSYSIFPWVFTPFKLGSYSCFFIFHKLKISAATPAINPKTPAKHKYSFLKPWAQVSKTWRSDTWASLYSQHTGWEERWFSRSTMICVTKSAVKKTKWRNKVLIHLGKKYHSKEVHCSVVRLSRMDEFHNCVFILLIYLFHFM